MKATFAAAAAMAAAGAHAQSISYTTMTIEDCSSMPMETMITVTEGTTVTYCPECDMTQGPGYTTVYTTTYMSLCPTGTVPATYTVTESCTGETPTWTPGPSHIPQGFTVTEKVCHVCDKTPTTVTITEPCGCEAHEGTPVPNPNPNPTPGGGSGGSPPSTPTGGSSPPACNGDDCGGNGHQTPSCNGDDCPPSGGSPPAKPPGTSPGHGGGAPPYPTPTTTTEQCPGPQCRAHETGGLPPGVEPPPGNNTGIVPTGGASSSLAFVSSAIMAVIVAALAFAL
jgi:hypothetical protein